MVYMNITKIDLLNAYQFFNLNEFQKFINIQIEKENKTHMNCCFCIFFKFKDNWFCFTFWSEH